MLSGQLFRLRRYNGDSQHTNKIERDKIDGFHIHKATSRYQESGFQEDAFAEKSIKYDDWNSALSAMLSENNFIYYAAKGQKRLS